MKKKKIFLIILIILILCGGISFIIYNKIIKKSIPIIENESYYSISYTTTISKNCPLDIYAGDYILINNNKDLNNILNKTNSKNSNKYFSSNFFKEKKLVLVSGTIEEISIIGDTINISTTSRGSYFGNLEEEEQICNYRLIPIDKSINNIKVNHYYYDKDYVY